MAFQKSVAVRNASLDSAETTIGTTPIMQVRSGAPPADCAAADSGTLLASATLPSDWMSAASAGAKAKLGTWQDASADATGTSGHFRIKDSGGSTCHMQGTCGVSVPLTTNNTTAANGNVLNFASTTGVSVGMNISGTGVVAGCTVVATTGTTVTMSLTSTAGVANGAAIAFAPDMTIDNSSINSGQTVTFNTFTITAGNV